MPMRALIVQRCSRQFLGTNLPSLRLASSSSEAKDLSQITGQKPPTPPDSTTTVAGQAFPGDLRSTSALGFGDNLLDHTSKWMQVCACFLCANGVGQFICPHDPILDLLLQHAQPGQGGNETSPMEYVWRAEPIKVHGAVEASYGSERLNSCCRHHAECAAICLSDVCLLCTGENPALGCPVEYINLKGSSREHPVVCKYTGNKYYSDDWRGSH